MAIKIEHIADIAKLMGGLKLAVSGEFKISKKVLEDVLVRVHEFAKENGVSIKIISPTGEKILEFTGAGIILGSIIGGYLGGIPGALGGAVVGAISGFVAAHITLTMSSTGSSEYVVLRTN